MFYFLDGLLLFSAFSSAKYFFRDLNLKYTPLPTSAILHGSVVRKAAELKHQLGQETLPEIVLVHHMKKIKSVT